MNSTIITVILVAIGLGAVLALLMALTSRPSNDPDLPPRL